MNAEVIAAPEMTVEQAERITEQISFRIDSITENYEVVMTLMRDALARDAHSALGYASPGAYIADRFGKSLQTLGAALRREFVHELSDAGLSTRAIAPVFGVNQATIVRDIKRGDANASPDHEAQFIEKYGVRPDEADALLSSGFIKTADDWHAAVEGMTVNTRTGEVIEDAPVITEHTVTEKVKTVTGLDGKEYKRPERSAPRAEAITSQFMSAIADLNRVMARLRRISDDKNFARNKEQVASLHASDLYRTISELETLADSLKGN